MPRKPACSPSAKCLTGKIRAVQVTQAGALSPSGMKMPDRNSRAMIVALTSGVAASALGTIAVIANPSAQKVAAPTTSITRKRARVAPLGSSAWYVSTPVDCRTIPIRGFSRDRCRPGSTPGTDTSPPSRRRYPSRISTVVVFPAPLGPQQREDLTVGNLQVDARDGRHVAVRRDQTTDPHRHVRDRPVHHDPRG